VTETAQQAQLLDADAVTRLSQLEMVATRIMEGFISGMHRSPFKGASVEFAEHRPYTPGDEVRVIDWRIYARSDRYYIKQFEQETNLQALLIVDASGSMGFGASTVTKLHYAQMASACLARLMLRQGDAVGLAVVDTDVRSYVPPRSKPSHFRVLLDVLAGAHPKGETLLPAALDDVVRRLRRRGLVIVCSDCFGEVDALTSALSRIQARGHETMLLHVMAPEELSFSFTKWSRFECLEVPELRLDLDPGMIRKEYLERVRVFLDALKDGCAEVKCDYASLPTDGPLGDALAYYVSRRAMRLKRA